MNSTIVFLHPHFLKFGGASKVVLEQASRLQKLGEKVQIITTRSNPKIIADYPGLEIIELSALSTGSLLFWTTFPVFFVRLVRQLNTVPHKIIYAHSLSIYWGYLYKLLYPNQKLVLYFHDLGFPYFDSPAEKNSLPQIFQIVITTLSPIFKLFHRQIIKDSDHLIANSQTTFNAVNNLYHRPPDIVIFPGVNLNIFRPTKVKKDYFITVGRLEKIKNLETTITGFSMYLQANPKIKTKLVIVGSGPEKNSLQRLTQKLQITNRVRFFGNRTPSQLAKLYGHAQLGIFMSPFESFGLAAVECLASGTPIVGVNQNGIGEIIHSYNHNELTENTPTSLSKKLSGILKRSLDLTFPTTYSTDNQITKLRQFFETIQ